MMSTPLLAEWADWQDWFTCTTLSCVHGTVVQVLGPTDKAQSTMVAAWLTELLLDQINRDLLAAAGQHTPDYLQHVEQLRWVLRGVLMAAVALMAPLWVAQH